MAIEYRISKKEKMALVTDGDESKKKVDEPQYVQVSFDDLDPGQDVRVTFVGTVIEVNPRQKQVLIRLKSGLKPFYVMDDLTYEVPLKIEKG